MQRIYYGNATTKQREYIESRINNELALCQSALIDALMQSDAGQRMGFDVDHIENERPDPSDWDMDRCREWLGYDEPDPNPWTMTRDELIDTGYAGIGIDTRDEYAHVTDDEARGQVISAMDSGDLDGLEDWRQAVRDHAEPAEIFEWWALSNSFIVDELRALGEPILDNDYGTWWGRTCTGQSISLDPTFWDIFQDALQKGYAD
ncbi:MAG: hypothetical protein ABFD89_12590 [Bryobacteraceae bacterium]